MTLHTPVHQLGVSPHPHVLRNLLAVVGVLIVAVVVVIGAQTIKISPTTTTADRYMTPEMIEFRAGERAVVPLAFSVTDPFMTPQSIQFRADERAVDK